MSTYNTADYSMPAPKDSSLLHTCADCRNQYADAMFAIYPDVCNFCAFNRFDIDESEDEFEDPMEFEDDHYLD